MEKIETLITLLATLVCLNSLAEKIKIPYPIILVITGILFGLSPQLPSMNLNPNVVFLIFLPPLLYDAANNTSWHEIKRWRIPIFLLAVNLVLFTTIGVAAAAHFVIPGFTWQLGFILGAVVSPPDAVAATSATKGLHLPKHIIAILEGESLINDASALIIYRYALMAVVGGSTIDLSDASLEFMVVSGSGIAIGLTVGYCISLIHKNLINSTIGTTISILTPFICYLIAEEFEVSGVLAVVTCGIYMAWHSSELFHYRTRLTMKGFWEILIFVLNGLVFILIGLQLPNILESQTKYSIEELIGFGLFISLIVILIRIIWIFGMSFTSFLIYRTINPKIKFNMTLCKEVFIISWSGMRGVVSLASAMAIPLTLDNGANFPQRDIILFITFVVILVTLVFQGLTLPFLVKKLKVQESPLKSKEDEHKLRLQILESMINFIDNNLTAKLDPKVINDLRDACEHRMRYFKLGLNQNNNGYSLCEEELEIAKHMHQYFEGEIALINHQRQLLKKAHKENSFSDEIIRKIEHDLDAFSVVVQTRMNGNK